MHALILAGGFATRLWPLTEKVAKPLVPLAGKPLLNYMIDSLLESGNITISISTNAVFGNDFENWKKAYYPQQEIDIFIEDSKGEQTKKGALAATALFIEERKIESSLMLLAGDNYFGFRFDEFISQGGENPLVAAYDIGSKDEAKKFGVIVPKNKYEVLEFEEKPEHPSSTFVSTGAYIFPQKCLEDIIFYSKEHADDLGGVFEYFLNKGTDVHYFSFEEDWYDIGSFGAFMDANKRFLSGEQKIDTSSELINTELEGSCVIEKNVKLENVFLKNSIILEGTTLKNCDVEDSVIGLHCLLEDHDFRGKIIREKTVLVG